MRNFSIALGAIMYVAAGIVAADAQTDPAARRQELIRKHETALKGLEIPPKLCHAPIIDQTVSPVAELGTLCDYAATLIEGAAGTPRQVLPLVSLRLGSDDVVGFPMRERGRDDVMCVFRNLRGDLVLLAAVEGTASAWRESGVGSLMCLASVFALRPPPSNPPAEAKTLDPPKPEPKKPTVDTLVDSILKNQDSKTKVQTPEQQPKPVQQVTRTAPTAPNLAAVVTASEIEGVRARIRPCWLSAGGAREAPVVTLTVQLSQNGTPVKAEIQDTGRYHNDAVFRAAADAAHKAIMNPRCQPWPLSAEKFNGWRTITFNFDPRDY